MTDRRFYLITIGLIADQIWARRARAVFSVSAFQPFSI